MRNLANLGVNRHHRLCGVVRYASAQWLYFLDLDLDQKSAFVNRKRLLSVYLEMITRLGRQATVCVGNGRNDRLMLKEAALGIAVMLDEGIAAEALLAADVVCRDILSALALLLHPLRLVATLRI